jgi:hypothetical protein
MDYTLAQAKRDFDRGFLAGFDLRFAGFPAMDGGFWFVELRSKLGMDSIGVLLDARSKSPREFKTLDAAVSACRQIGFKAAWISSGEMVHQ